MIRGDIDEIDSGIDLCDLFDLCRKKGAEETDYEILDTEDRVIVPWN